MSPLKNSPAWKALDKHRQTAARLSMRELFARDRERFRRFSVRLGDMLLDFSKNRMTQKTWELLVDLAREADVEGWRTRMFAGDKVNGSEGRAALHVALRDLGEKTVIVDGRAVAPEVKSVLERVFAFADGIRDGRVAGAAGRPFQAVVNVGIGGSDLGPALVTEALAPYHRPGLQFRFVSNADKADIAGALRDLEPATTLFVVASKTFRTEETLLNATTAKAWLAEALGWEAATRHFAAVTANPEAAEAFGIAPDRVFRIWDWVGGRTSVWSAVGLPVVLAVGKDRFLEFLAGARAMDEHFLAAPLAANMPVALALVGVWNANFLGAEAHAVLPYDQHLARLPAHLRQLEMESGGKSVTRDGRAIAWATAPVVFGEPGTNGQHAFHQLIHQGTRLVSCDFIAAAVSHHGPGPHHEVLLANFFAQPEALMLGRTLGEAAANLKAQGMSAVEAARLAPHRVFPGNRPSNSILVRKFDPSTLGMLLALYEHKVFVAAAIWEVNPFDQWGVELGKELAKAILPELQGQAPPADRDSSTAGLVAHYKKLRSESS